MHQTWNKADKALNVAIKAYFLENNPIDSLGSTWDEARWSRRCEPWRTMEAFACFFQVGESFADASASEHVIG
jgi:hypothetical protein